MATERSAGGTSIGTERSAGGNAGATRTPVRGAAANPAPPTVCRVRVRFAKRGRLRFASHRDVARAFERAIRRAALPVSHSHGFNPRPRLSWVGAAPTGTASEAEYLEIGLTEAVDTDRLVAGLDEALPDGLDVLAAAEARPGGPALADLIDASEWEVTLPGVAAEELRAALESLMASDEVIVRRATKNGPRPVDVRAAVARAEVIENLRPGIDGRSGDASGTHCAIMTAVVRQTTPAVRPDDVLGALQIVAGLKLPVPAKAVRLAQGLLDDRGHLADPFDAVRATTSTATEGTGA